jgi:hypothetical protein
LQFCPHPRVSDEVAAIEDADMTKVKVRKRIEVFMAGSPICALGEAPNRLLRFVLIVKKDISPAPGHFP